MKHPGCDDNVGCTISIQADCPISLCLRQSILDCSIRVFLIAIFNGNNNNGMTENSKQHER